MTLKRNYRYAIHYCTLGLTKGRWINAAEAIGGRASRLTYRKKRETDFARLLNSPFFCGRYA